MFGVEYFGEGFLFRERCADNGDDFLELFDEGTCIFLFRGISKSSSLSGQTKTRERFGDGDCNSGNIDDAELIDPSKIFSLRCLGLLRTVFGVLVEDCIYE